MILILLLIYFRVFFHAMASRGALGCVANCFVPIISEDFSGGGASLVM